MRTQTIIIGSAVGLIIILVCLAIIYIFKLRGRLDDLESAKNLTSVASTDGLGNNLKVISRNGKSAAQMEIEKRARNFRHRAKRDSTRSASLTTSSVSPDVSPTGKKAKNYTKQIKVSPTKKKGNEATEGLFSEDSSVDYSRMERGETGDDNSLEEVENVIKYDRGLNGVTGTDDSKEESIEEEMA